MTGSARVICADARSLPLEDDSIDLIVTSPPYFQLRSYTGEPGQVGDEQNPADYVAALLDVTREMMRVLKPTGSMWVNLGDKYSTGSSSESNLSKLGAAMGTGGGHKDGRAKRGSSRLDGWKPKSLIGLPWRYALACVDELDLILRAEVIWSKTNGLPESVTDRVRRSHEQWFHLVLQPRYFADLDGVREPYAPGSLESYRRGGAARAVTGRHPSSENGSQKGSIPAGWQGNPLGRTPGSVWTVATEALSVPERLGIDHFAAFPLEWPRRLIQGWCPPEGTVLDPFGGTGTTALAARALGRRGISVDLSPDYCRLAEWRVNDPGEIARAMRVAKPEPVHEDQMTLLDTQEG